MLCLPCLGLGYFWDDYYFLTFRGRGDPRTYLWPDPQAMFYRPIAQGLYFILLRFADPASGILGHVLNLVTLAVAVVLLVLLVSRLSGPSAGLYAGLVFATLGCVPSLVAWISCSQDLLAIVLVLAAFLLRDRGRSGPALACAAGAVLCKEPAIAAFPVLALWDLIVGRRPSRLGVQVAGYLAVAVAWVIIHPGLQHLAERGFRSGTTGYVGLEHPERWGRYLARYLLTLVNLPAFGLSGSWWEPLAPFGLVALVILVIGLLLIHPRTQERKPAGAIPLWRMALIAGMFGLPTLLLPVLLVRHWAPYFTCIPAVGLVIFAGPLLARQRSLIVLLGLAVFLLLGIRFRGLTTANEPVWTERVFAEAMGAVKITRSSFRAVFPGFPPRSQIALSVATTGVRGIRSTLIDGQALSVWYHEPSLRTVDVLEWKPGATTECLARVTTDLDVIRIDPDHERVTSNNPAAIDITEVGRPLRNYARAVAAGGDIDRAVRLTEWLARMESGWGTAYAHHLSAMFLLYGGRRDEASKILATTPAFPREDALAVVRRLLAEPSESEKLDDTAFEAFGLSSSDPEAIRWVMRDFVHDGAMAQAAWYAQRLLRLTPGDPEGVQVIRDAERSGAKPRRAG